jgi:hypothetical protein
VKVLLSEEVCGTVLHRIGVDIESAYQDRPLTIVGLMTAASFCWRI